MNDGEKKNNNHNIRKTEKEIDKMIKITKQTRSRL